MTEEAEPNLIVSSLSRPVTWNGFKLRLEIYRLDDRPGWTLEMVNPEGTSIVWDDLFDTDKDAEAEFRSTLATEGIVPFVSDGNVVPFRKRPH